LENPKITTSQMVQDPLWLAHRYDPQHDAVHFRLVTRAMHGKVIFITDEYLPDNDPVKVVRRVEALANLPERGPVHFIFHSAFCCSTLLARVFDAPGVAMALKEPVILNDISGWQQRGGDKRQINQVLDGTLALLARRFAPGEAVVIKPSNVVNALAPAMLDLRPEARAVLLYAPLETYLRSVAKKGMWGRIWVRDLLVKLLRDGLIDLGFATEDYLGLTDLQVAAVGWLAQQALFARMQAQFGARVMALDSEALLAEPENILSQVVDLFEFNMSSDAIRAIVAGPVFTRHSKFDQAFGAAERAAEYDAAWAVHGDEIDKVAVWAAAVAKNAGVEMRL
jgi:hypothetical protein